jgi:hypothetical protein
LTIIFTNARDLLQLVQLKFALLDHHARVPQAIRSADERVVLEFKEYPVFDV